MGARKDIQQMNFVPPVGEMHLREASSFDIPIMATHHKKMFEEIWEKRNEQLNPIRAIEVENAYAQKLEIDMKNGICRAWVIEDKEIVVASGAVSFASFVPTPSNLSFNIAYVHSIYTEKSHRNARCAQQIIHNIITHCQSQGIMTIMLRASDAGRAIYQKIGFQPDSNMMIMIIQ
jgi:GNAT superfamily N-acetyltransferase